MNRGGGARAQESPATADRRAIGLLRLLPVAWVAALAGLLAALPAHAERLLVVTANDSPAYRQALAGIQRQSAKLPIEVRPIATENVEALSRALASGGRGTVLIALGPRAGDAIARTMTDAPVVGCLVPSVEATGPASGPIVPSDIPIDAQIGWLRRLLPDARRVGLLYDPALNGRRVDALAIALELAGYTVSRAPVASPTMLPDALGRLGGSADVILGLPDATVYTPRTAKALLLHSFRHKIPLVGLSDSWVKAGALYGLDWDYEDVGGHCAMLAVRQLGSGRSAAPIPPPRPRVAVNLRTAAQLNLNWDPDIVRGVDRTFE